jgi:hypothetical protein
MATIPATQLPSQIQTLLKLREQHTAAVSQIDKTLAGIVAALGGPRSTAIPARANRSPAAKPPAANKRKRRGTFSVSASDLVLEFIKASKNPTTQEIMQHLASKGRSASSGSNALSVLTSANKLKRAPLGKGVLGSRYSLA